MGKYPSNPALAWSWASYSATYVALDNVHHQANGIGILIEPGFLPRSCLVFLSEILKLLMLQMSHVLIFAAGHFFLFFAHVFCNFFLVFAHICMLFVLI